MAPGATYVSTPYNGPYARPQPGDGPLDVVAVGLSGTTYTARVTYSVPGAAVWVVTAGAVLSRGYHRSAACPICGARVIVRARPGVPASLLRALALADHAKTLHASTVERRAMGGVS